MDLKTLIMLVVQLSLLLLIMAVGMRSRFEDLLYAFRKPADLGKALLAVNVVVPLTAALVASLLPLDWATKAGLIIMAVSPLAPFASGKMLKASTDRSYVVGLYAALVLLAVVIVPVTVAMLNPFYDRHADVSIAEVAWFVFKSVCLPLAAGMFIATYWPNFAEKAAPIATMITYAVIIPLAVIYLFRTGPQLAALIGEGAMVVIVATIVAGLAAGHLLGGPRPGHRAALAQAAATRHPGIAALVARDDFNSPNVMTAILLFLLTSVVLTIIYGHWMKRQFAAGGQQKSGAQ